MFLKHLNKITQPTGITLKKKLWIKESNFFQQIPIDFPTENEWNVLKRKKKKIYMYVWNSARLFIDLPISSGLQWGENVETIEIILPSES